MCLHIFSEDLNVYGITHIINLAAADCPMDARTDGVQVMNVLVKDDGGSKLSPYFPQLNEFLQQCRERHGKMLVHCFEGKSRSVACIIQFLMVLHQMTLRQAYDIVVAVRPAVRINGTFCDELEALDLMLWGKHSVLLKRVKKPLLSSQRKR